MIAYYRFAGVVAVVALVVNMILLVGSMAFMQATFSLPGLAGLALTIGMAVDANVLVFERMREEKERGASLAQQIRNGFNRAWVTIFDSHVTNLLAAVVLYAVGTQEVKGFALTMILGMLWNLFTAVFMSRVIFETAHSRGWLKELHFLKMLGQDQHRLRRPPVLLHGDFAGRHRCWAWRRSSPAASRCTTSTSPAARWSPSGSTRPTRASRTSPSRNASSSSANGPASCPTSRSRASASARPRRPPGSTSGRPHMSSDEVKDKIIESFGPALAKIEMTVGDEKPIPAAAAADAKPRPSSTGSPAAGSTTWASTPRRSTAPRRPRRSSPPSSPRCSPPPGSSTRAPGSRSLGGPAAAKSGAGTSLILKTDLEPDAAKTQLAALKDSLASNRDLLFERINTFGSTVAGETRTLAMIATVASWIIIIVYLWWRFHSFTYGLAAVLAVVHDVLITLGAIAVSYWLALIPGFSSLLMIEQFKIDLPIVAAFLTLIGFSVNDTIVIFDRIREIKGKSPHLTTKLVNDAINQTLSRTILTSLTAWLVVVVLYVLGGEGLHGFAFALVVGFLSGTYSTIYIATPILIDWLGADQAPVKPGELKKAATTR